MYDDRSGYDPSDYEGMIADKARTDAYVRALRQAVKPNAVVLDIGAGTGFFALLACRFGARKVYAIEPNDAVLVAPEIAAAHGCADRIEFIQDISTRVTLPERADVIVSDLRGVLPLYGQHIPSLADARKRLLAPDGVLIPQCDTLWVAVVSAPDHYERRIMPVQANPYDIDIRLPARLLTNHYYSDRVKPEQVFLEPQQWAALDYTTRDDPHVSGEVTWTATESGMAHGLSVWFDATLIEGVQFSNAPDAPEKIDVYGSAFFPWPTPVAVAAGDRVSVALQARLLGGDYIWQWHTDIWEPDHPEQMKAQFRQSTLASQLLSPAQLRKRANDYRPTLSLDGQIDQYILSLMQGTHTLEDVARHVFDAFSASFVDWQDALERVRKLSEMYSQ